ncbi:zf-HC2 domain-containing protein [Aneurinibacillus sp. Ricciae_BoGa-3]|uniref:zf-HC2 domain-containing protein n=1 Tax=Aneurinibacillus sp. Ricciae_BoGa-3 TaxID=3022697 RepID=UPI002340E56F|nr:zf-HC2 domain-containing protein [Aneurinibacillus sp. Ricciae_BoGa-3]WCK54805.1 zf-HC2 domain-containing protein [Aneurinibacillus sp. Ricciae_BoGa-3]
MTCKEAVCLIHLYLDGGMAKNEEERLGRHLAHCEACSQHIHELKKTAAFVRGLSQAKAPEGFTEKVIARLPRQRTKLSWQRQLKNHPFLVAATLFVVLMAGSMMSAWTHGQGQFEFSAPRMQHLTVDENHHTVIVPAGQVVNGDIVVRNGKIRVDGDVNGNVIAIDGQVLQASTAHISGEVQEINKALEWVWYTVKTEAGYLFSGK